MDEIIHKDVHELAWTLDPAILRATRSQREPERGEEPSRRGRAGDCLKRSERARPTPIARAPKEDSA
jgi:hypothetical protein